VFATLKRARIAARRTYQRSSQLFKDGVSETGSAWTLGLIAWLFWAATLPMCLLSLLLATAWALHVPSETERFIKAGYRPPLFQITRR
jgi:hypothetical protein